LETRARQSRKLALVANQGTSMSSDELALQRQRAERARAALEQVRPSEREALILRYNAELSFQEVGLARGIDEATARKRVSRGIARLRDLLQEEEQT
jgi:RNA polymerase sigma-70 factor (ECF subfamily)